MLSMKSQQELEIDTEPCAGYTFLIQFRKGDPSMMYGMYGYYMMAAEKAVVYGYTYEYGRVKRREG